MPVVAVPHAVHDVLKGTGFWAEVEQIRSGGAGGCYWRSILRSDSRGWFACDRTRPDFSRKSHHRRRRASRLYAV